MKNMTKILMYIDHHYGGGAQRVMTNLANHFVSNGIEVVFVVDVNDERKIRNIYPEAVEYPLLSDIRVISLEKNSGSKALASNWDRIVGLRRVVKEEKPDVVLSFLGRVNIRMLISTFGLMVIKCVSVRNAPEHEYGSSWIVRLVTNVIFLLSDKYVFQTEDAKKWFFKSIQRKSRVIVNPIADVFFETKYEGGSDDIVTIGRLDNAKNHMLLIDAFGKVCEKFSEINLKIYGTGPLKKLLQHKIDDMELSDRVILCGPTNDVPAILKKARLFVLASDYEGMPNALMEAMAVGVPCISTDCPVGGPRALFGDDLKQSLVKCGDSEAMSDKIINMLEQDNLATVSDITKTKAMEFQPNKIYETWRNYLFDQ